jgi:hypothetical protein
MNQEELKLIYSYMQDFDMLWMYCHNGTCEHSLDSNSAWECVQEMEKRKDYPSFEQKCLSIWLKTVVDLPSEYFTAWLFNPTNFFKCFAAFLKEREGI